MFTHPSHSLTNSNASSKAKITEEEIIGVCSLTYSILGVEGCAKAHGWEIS
jgi:hypothetical protein